MQNFDTCYDVIPASGVVRGDFKLVHDSIKPLVWSRRSSNLSECSLTTWAVVLGFAALTLGLFGLAVTLTAHTPNLDSDKFGNSMVDQTGWLD